jgi:hypothetical protein
MQFESVDEIEILVCFFFLWQGLKMNLNIEHENSKCMSRNPTKEMKMKF